jgi:hypothetical protein
VPRDLVQVERRAEEIDVGVAVHPNREGRNGTVGTVDDVLHPRARRMAAVVFVPGDPSA